MKDPKISVIIPVYNGANYLQEAIESVLNQTYQNFELIVVDDGSNDGGATKRIINAYENRVVPLFKENGGVASALNKGIINATGDFIAWLSHDDLFKLNCLETFVSAIYTDSSFGAYYGNYDIINEKGEVYNYLDFAAQYTTEQLSFSVFPVLFGCVNGCALLVKKSEYERCGLFNEKLMIAQDNDMWFRIFHNRKVCYIRQILSSKRYHSAQDSVKKDVAPEEDDFLFKGISSISPNECSAFFGSRWEFFHFFERLCSDGKHEKTRNYCLKQMENSKHFENYMTMEKDELCKELGNINAAYEKLKLQYENLQRQYIRLWM